MASKDLVRALWSISRFYRNIASQPFSLTTALSSSKSYSTRSTSSTLDHILIPRACSNRNRLCRSATGLMSNHQPCQHINAAISTASSAHLASLDIDIDSEMGSWSPTSVYQTESVIYPSTWQRFADVEIEDAQLSPTSGGMVDVQWREKTGAPSDAGSTSSASSSFPLVWLRDNCRCPKCFNPFAQSRTAAFRNIDVDCKARALLLADDAKILVIDWSDGHQSQFPAQFLRCHAFSESEIDPVVDVQPRLWDATVCRENLRFFDLNDVLHDDRSLYELLMEVKVLGMAVVENAPSMVGQIKRIAKKVGYLQPSNYGETFQVQSKVDPSNVAYTSAYLPLHTDLSYFMVAPGIQMLHCIKQADLEGGENPLVDGFKVAEDLRKEAPDLFDVLTENEIEFYDCGVDEVGGFYQHSRHKIISLNREGNVDRIVFSDHGRSAMSRIPVDDIIMTYRAMARFAEKIYDPTNIFEYKLRDGDILIMDNQRVLHGRNAFTMNPGTARHLEGGYFQWDTVMSRIRVLKKKLEGLP